MWLDRCDAGQPRIVCPALAARYPGARSSPMTNIVVLVKQVPATYSERKLSDSDHTLDRDSADAVLDEINERAIEEALVIKEAHDGEVTVLSVGPERATDAIR